MTEQLAELYCKYFQVYPEVNDQPDRLREAYRLRYQVYCLENSFEDPSRCNDDLETDRFDDRSIHSLLIYRQTNTPAGTVRLVLPASDDPRHSLPIDQVCDEPTLRDPKKLPRASLAEVSRFAVSKAFRRRRGDDSSASGVGRRWDQRHARGEERKIPHLSLGLIQALVHNSSRHGITHWCAEMEPALLRMLRYIGIHFVNLGHPIDYHGIRQPCYAELDSMLARVKKQRPDVWELITDYGCLWPKGQFAANTGVDSSKVPLVLQE